MDLQKSLPVVLAALAVLVLGCLNPKYFQDKKTGQVRYETLALAALVVGLLAQYLQMMK